jgi:hypothetical protein
MDRGLYDSLWDKDQDESEAFPFGEDDAELDAIIEEEMGASRRKSRRKRQFN